MFFVGVQLDITLIPPTPHASSSPLHHAQSRFIPAQAATAGSQQSQAIQQMAVLPSPAASQQAQSQVH